VTRIVAVVAVPAKIPPVGGTSFAVTLADVADALPHPIANNATAAANRSRRTPAWTPVSVVR
jgi:hypothetical protein